MQFYSIVFKSRLNRGTQAKNATSCGNARVTNIMLPQAPADVTDFIEELFERARKKSGRNYAKA